VAAIALVVLPIMVPACGASADEASPWDKGMHSAMRLIAAGSGRDGANTWLRAGIEIRLEPGWKTYWRYPGDSGVPPRFDFAHSENVKRVTVGWPAPHRFSDEAGQSIGYKEHVIFPLHVEPQDAGKPATLRLDVDYAICQKLCIPAQGKAELVVTGTPTSQQALLAAAEARLPQPRALGEGTTLSVAAVRRDPGGRVVVDLKAAEPANLDLFAEGPTPEWALPLPEPIPDAPAGAKRFAFALDGLPPGATADGAMLTFTAIAGDAAIEVKYRLP
jgi:DsbC/DsbD-like thiol-disulfide interchange protein